MAVFILIVVFIILCIFILNIGKGYKPAPKGIQREQTLTMKEMGFKYQENYELTGIHFPEVKGYIMGNCKKHDQVTIEREPDNPVNPKALKVRHGGIPIGYIADHDLDEVYRVFEKEHMAAIDNIHFFDGWLDVDILIVGKEDW